MIVDVSLLKPEWDDVIVVKVDYGNMPAHHRTKVSELTLIHMKEIFPKNKILIHGLNTTVKVKTESKVLNFFKNLFILE